jgi:hypothetical protein
MEKANCTRATAACLRPCSHQGGYERGEKQAPNQERKQSEPDAYELVERIEKLISDRFITDLPTYVSGLRRNDPVKYDLNAGPRVINVRFVINLLQIEH